MGRSRKSKDVRQDRVFLRNEYRGEEILGIPIIEPVEISDSNIELISFTDAKKADKSNCQKYVHCFQDDYKLQQAYTKPDNKIEALARYRGVFTPDYSLYPEMPPWRQIQSVAQSRWCGAHWQFYGLTVIPIISWSDESSFDYCFLGLRKGGTVAVSTVGCLSESTAFLKGYNQMMRVLEPTSIICYGEKIAGMIGNVIYVDYLTTTRRKNKWVDEEAMPAEILAS